MQPPYVWFLVCPTDTLASWREIQPLIDLQNSHPQKLIECVDDKDQLLIAQPGFAYQQFLFLAFTPVSIHQTLGARQLLPSRAITASVACQRTVADQ